MDRSLPAGLGAAGATPAGDADRSRLAEFPASGVQVGVGVLIPYRQVSAVYLPAAVEGHRTWR